ncbi:kinase-like domain-containing protein [Roridomyces roridus]|uniref:Casein kinase II subunit alpha n=1 Tax=Roridomyces roridus TaxID=1738132 RepID=A0AAD7G015_9AGAR|nr:kinase-like domain-containing protein [Roridomyces roridus]
MSHDACSLLGKSWYDYENFHIDWSQDTDRYEVVRRLGGGKYSEVFEGIDTVTSDRCVIKVLKPVAPKKIKREIKVLRNLCGLPSPNVIGLLDVVQSRGNPSLVMEYVENVEWKRLFPRLTAPEIQYYTSQLLLALSAVHDVGIIHRDIKPANIMIDVKQRKLRLIDWGLAEFYHPNVDYHIRVGSRYYKAPELLVGYKRYDYSLDMWSVGCMFASMIFRKEHFFRGSDNDDQLLKIMKTLGTEEFDSYLKTYNIHFETEIDSLLINYPKQPWTRFITAENRHLASSDALDLLGKLLRYDHHERLTSKEAEAHPYFNSIRLEASGKTDSASDSGFGST